MLGTGAEMWGDAALGCKANERWNEGINPLGDKSVAAKKASLVTENWYKSWTHGSCTELGWELLTQARAEGSGLTPQPWAVFWSGVRHQRVKNTGKGSGSLSPGRARQAVLYKRSRGTSRRGGVHRTECAEDFGGDSGKVTAGTCCSPPPALQPAGTGRLLRPGARQVPPQCCAAKSL